MNLNNVISTLDTASFKWIIYSSWSQFYISTPRSQNYNDCLTLIAIQYKEWWLDPYCNGQIVLLYNFTAQLNSNGQKMISVLRWISDFITIHDRGS